MTDLQQLLDEYLATRRALGVRLKLTGSLLQRFVAFAAQSEAAFITTEHALQWATEPRGVQPAQWASRLGMVRRFARFAHAVDPRHEVPPPGLLSGRYRRSQPYLYSDAEIDDLLRAAQGLSGITGLRPCTYATLLALLGGHRDAKLRTAAPEPRRCRPRTRRADGAAKQVRKIEIHPCSRFDTPGAGRLRGAARRPLSQSRESELLPLGTRRPGHRVGPAVDVREAVPPRRPGRSGGFPRSPSA